MEEALKKISQLSPEKQDFYIRKLIVKLEGKRKETNLAEDIQQDLASAVKLLANNNKFTHAELIDNHLDVHPQYLNEERLLMVVNPIIEELELSTSVKNDVVTKDLAEIKKELKTQVLSLSETIKAVKVELSENNIKSSNVLTKKLEFFDFEVKKLSLATKKNINLEDINFKQAGRLKVELDDLLAQTQLFALKSELPNKVDVKAATTNVVVVKETKDGVDTFNIGVKNASVLGIGGGGVNLTPIQNQIDLISAGLSNIAGGSDNFVLRSGDTMNGNLAITGATLLLTYAGNTTAAIDPNTQLKSSELAFVSNLWNGAAADHSFRIFALPRSGISNSVDLQFYYDNTNLLRLSQTGQAVALNNSSGFAISTSATGTSDISAHGFLAQNTSATARNFSGIYSRNAVGINNGAVIFRNLGHSPASTEVGVFVTNNSVLDQTFLIGSSGNFGMGIGVTAPYGQGLHIGISLGGGRGLILQNRNTNTDTFTDIEWIMSSADNARGRIRYRQTNAVSSADGDMSFFTYNGASANGNFDTAGINEAMRIKHNGRIAIGTTTKLASLTVAGVTQLTLVGTVSGLSGTNQIGGVGTDFLQELTVGSRVTIGSDTVFITSIESGVSATTDTNNKLTATTAGTSLLYTTPVFMAQNANGVGFFAVSDTGEVVVGGSVMSASATGVPLSVTSLPSSTLATVLNLRNPNGGANSGPIVRFVSSGAPNGAAQTAIASYRTNVPNAGSGDIGFQTSYAGGGNMLENMRIKATGNIGFGIGNSNAQSLIHFTTGTSVGGMRVGTRRVGASAVVNIFDYYIGVSSNVAVTLTLPNGSSAIDAVYKFKDEGANATLRNITIAAQAGEVIDGAATAVISLNYGKLEIIGASGAYYTI